MTLFRSATLILIGWLGLLAAELPAAIRLPALFCDHMVLQSEKPAAIWGWAQPEARIRVSFADDSGQVAAKAEAIAGHDGKWSLVLRPLPANLRGKISLSSDRGDSWTVNDVLVGEVWLGSGQSNMTYPINAANAPPDVLATAKEQARAEAGGIRYFAVVSPGAAVPQADVKGHWVVVGPEQVGTCSAVAWDFAVVLRRHLHRPVGLVVSAVGGTPAEAWISKSALDATSVGSAIEQRNADALAATPPDALERYQKSLAEWKKAYPTPQLQATHRAPPEPYSSAFRMVPCRLYNGKIHGLEPYTMKGILWFQADGNERHPEEYGELIQTLIRTWRERWQDQLPFYYVEENNIHAYQTQPAELTGLAFVRDAENAALALPGVDVATSVDLGLGSEAHFPNKLEVGRRLAGLALNNLYGQPGLVHSPQFESVQIEGRRVHLKFKYAEGLRTRNGQPVRGFALRGDDGKWVWAEGKIENQAIEIWSDQVPRPAAVRYGWGANPVLSVENAVGLPLRPFRTDADAIVPYPQPDWLPSPKAAANSSLVDPARSVGRRFTRHMLPVDHQPG